MTAEADERPRHYTLDSANHSVPAPDFAEWARWMIANNEEPRGRDPEGMDRCRVGSTRRGDVWVSTVFTARDMRPWASEPVLFETMVFGGPQAGARELAATWDEASETHRRVCAEVFGEYADD
jgi:hypothetical protein